MTWQLHAFDSLPADVRALVDDGLGQSNDSAAPLQEVQPLGCAAARAPGEWIGGAVGRTWGRCGELQQLWVHPAHRRGGVGTALVQGFVAQASVRGCTSLFLETFSFQAPGFYEKLGFTKWHANNLFPHGIVKYLMVRRIGVG